MHASIGKRVVNDLYLHLEEIDAALQADQAAAVRTVLARVGAPSRGAPNVVKFNLRDGRISLLSYLEFDSAPFPQLAASWTLGSDGELRCRYYDESLNPPILHRKELLVSPSWPGREVWVQTTQLAESLGLFDDSHTIGLRGNWDRLLELKGYCVRGANLVPLGNDDGFGDLDGGPPTTVLGSGAVCRHLTALSRVTLSAPVQAVLRAGVLAPGMTVFDYGCGRGDDVRGLAAAGFTVGGWDPYYAADRPLFGADLVNLGFVINVIEDPVERAEALQRAATLAHKVLVVSVMLMSCATSGTPFADGVLSRRNTFQKYYSQEELREYLEHALGLPANMVAPGVAFVFKDRDLEQRYLLSRYRRKDVAARLIGAVSLHGASKPPNARPVRERRATAAQTRRDELLPILSALWQLALDLGRWPYPEEVPDLGAVQEKAGSLTRALRLVQKTSDLKLLENAANSRKEDVLLYLAMQQFSRRTAYKRLDGRLQRDIKGFFGTYGAAYSAASALLRDSGDPDRLLAACEDATARGLGYLDGNHSLQTHVSLVERLPAVLRAYISCALVLWDETSAVQLVKVHIGSGKVTLLEVDDFDGRLLPRLLRRIKINLRKLDYQVFEYGTTANPSPLLYDKSRYINEEHPTFERQLAFDEALRATRLLDDAGKYGPSEALLAESLELLRLQVSATGLEPSDCIPSLDQRCGLHFCYRDFVACGETQHQLGVLNLPLRPETYNALHALATRVLDPVIEYFGGIRLTYGFSCAGLASKIPGRIAPKLDQHAGCELSRSGALICSRAGAACDFLVEDENMREVAEWVLSNVPFDRLYFYGDDRPIHVSYGPQNSGEAYVMVRSQGGALIPRRFRPRVTT